MSMFFVRLGAGKDDDDSIRILTTVFGLVAGGLGGLMQLERWG